MINLTIYRFMLLNKAKEQQVLSFYNEEEDMLDTMNDFCKYIHENIRDYVDSQGKYRTFTLSKPQKKDSQKRIISGYFDSAYTGEKGKVKDRLTNNLKFNVSKDDLFSKDFFFLIYVPKGSKYGFLVAERKENHGVKSVFENAFNTFMRSKGVSNYCLELRQAPPRYFLNDFLDSGRLKEIKLISHTDLGKEERVFKLKDRLNDNLDLKNLLIELFNSNTEEERVKFWDKGDFDEISFVLNFNGSSKTFYVRDKDKIRSNINVSHLVKFDKGEPTTESLVKISLEIIQLAA